MSVSIYYKPSLFNAHIMILIVHIFMNVNKLCLNQTGKKSDNMFATIIRTALFFTILFTLFRTESFQYHDTFKNWGGGVHLKRIHNKTTQPMCYHYCFYTTDMRPNPSPIRVCL